MLISFCAWRQLLPAQSCSTCHSCASRQVHGNHVRIEETCLRHGMGMTLKQLSVGARADSLQQMSSWQRQRQRQRQQRPQVDKPVGASGCSSSSSTTVGNQGGCIKLCCKGVQQRWQQSAGGIYKQVSHKGRLPWGLERLQTVGCLMCRPPPAYRACHCQTSSSSSVWQQGLHQCPQQWQQQPSDKHSHRSSSGKQQAQSMC